LAKQEKEFCAIGLSSLIKFVPGGVWNGKSWAESLKHLMI
jgi:hypothetical protein